MDLSGLDFAALTPRVIASWFAIYFIVWWVVLFMILPIGVRSQHEAGVSPAPGVDPGAPVAPMLKKKALITTLVSAALMPALVIAYRTLIA